MKKHFQNAIVQVYGHEIRDAGKLQSVCFNAIKIWAILWIQAEEGECDQYIERRADRRNKGKAITTFREFELP